MDIEYLEQDDSKPSARLMVLPESAAELPFESPHPTPYASLKRQRNSPPPSPEKRTASSPSPTPQPDPGSEASEASRYN